MAPSPIRVRSADAVIVNRPFRQGDLIADMEGKPLPGWIVETGAENWAQLLLKFIISHLAVICAIPAASSVEHVRENMEAAKGSFLTPDLRKRIVDYVESL